MMRAAFGLAACAGLVLSLPASAGSWSKVTTNAPDNVTLMLTLPDGTIMCHNALPSGGGYGNKWFRLTPDATGNYTSGSWSTRGTASYTRLWFSSQVLNNDTVFVCGGEYGTGGDTAEVYHIGSDSWSTVTVPPDLIYTGPSGDAENSGFRDSGSVVLPNGNVLIAPVFPYSGNDTVIYNPYNNSLSVGPAYLNSQNEAGWVKLPDGSVLTIDKGGSTAERFIPSLNKWIADASPPVDVYTYGAEEGPGFLLPNGKAIFFGGGGNVAIYTPSGTTNNGSWVIGPSIPGGNGMPDAGGAEMPNGNILLAVAQAPTAANEWYTNVYFYVYNYSPTSTGSYTQENSPTGGLYDPTVSYLALMVVLPSGNVLYSHSGSDLYVYQPSAGPITADAPQISSVTPNSDGSFTVAGYGFNGVCEGGAYGDDAQMSSDYPLVRLTSGSTVTYAETYNWNSTIDDNFGIYDTVQFFGGDAFPGAWTLQVVANGNPSAGVTYYSPVWVDFTEYNTLFQFGTYVFPYPTLSDGVTHVTSGGYIFINANGDSSTSVSSETLTISTPMTITSIDGASTIGN